MNKYTKEEETYIKKFYRSLDEASQRRYAALETLKLGYGGKTYIKALLGISYDRIRRGLEEYVDEDLRAESGRIRKTGGGRKGKKMMNE